MGKRAAGVTVLNGAVGQGDGVRLPFVEHVQPGAGGDNPHRDDPIRQFQYHACAVTVNRLRDD